MDSSQNKTVVIIVGATAVGKTALAIELAKYFKTEIISADSRQCFKELNIGVARPSPEELGAVKHHFVASRSIADNVNAGTFEEYALQKTQKLFHTHDFIIMTGGTGLYIKAFCEGMDDIPVVPDEIRSRVISEYKEKGLLWLQSEVRRKDPKFYDVGEIENPQRLMRALEVEEATGKSLLEFHKGKKTERDFAIIKIGLELPKEELQRNINGRVDKMIEDGLVDEVRNLLPFRSWNALQTVGYTEIFEYLDGKISLGEAIVLIRKNTRHYAKRQMTWFKKDKEVRWYSPMEADKIKEHVNYFRDARSSGQFIS